MFALARKAAYVCLFSCVGLLWLVQPTPTTGAEKPDVQIVGAVLVPNKPEVGSTATFTLTLKNQGNGPAGAADYYFDVRFFDEWHRGADSLWVTPENPVEILKSPLEGATPFRLSETRHIQSLPPNQQVNISISFVVPEHATPHISFTDRIEIRLTSSNTENYGQAVISDPGFTIGALRTLNCIYAELSVGVTNLVKALGFPVSTAYNVLTKNIVDWASFLTSLWDFASKFSELDATEAMTSFAGFLFFVLEKLGIQAAEVAAGTAVDAAIGFFEGALSCGALLSYGLGKVKSEFYPLWVEMVKNSGGKEITIQQQGAWEDLDADGLIDIRIVDRDWFRVAGINPNCTTFSLEASEYPFFNNPKDRLNRRSYGYSGTFEVHGEYLGDCRVAITKETHSFSLPDDDMYVWSYEAVVKEFVPPNGATAGYYVIWLTNEITGDFGDIALVDVPRGCISSRVGRALQAGDWISFTNGEFSWVMWTINACKPDSSISLVGTYTTRDSDDDGVPDKVDSCPEYPGIPPSGCPAPPGDTTLAKALDFNANRVLDDSEIKRAVAYWITGEKVPGATEDYISDNQILELIKMWVNGEPVGNKTFTPDPDTQTDIAENADVIFERTFPRKIETGDAFTVSIKVTAKRELQSLWFQELFPPGIDDATDALSRGRSTRTGSMSAGDVFILHYDARATEFGVYVIIGTATSTASDGNQTELPLYSTINTNFSNNRVPTVSLSYSPIDPTIEEPVNFTATAIDLDGDELLYEWFLDGIKQDANAAKAWWEKPDSGTYTVTVQVSDGKGGIASDSVTFTVRS